MTIKEIHEKLNALITEDSTDAFILSIGEVNKALDEVETSYNESMQKANDIRAKYIDLIQSGNLGVSEKPEESEPRSLEDVILAHIKKS